MIVLFNISDSSGIRWQGDGIWRIAGRRRIYTFTRHDGRSERRAPLHHLDIKGKNKIQPLLSHCDRHGTFVLVHWPSNWIGFFFAVPFVFFFFHWNVPIRVDARYSRPYSRDASSMLKSFFCAIVCASGCVRGLAASWAFALFDFFLSRLISKYRLPSCPVSFIYDSG